MIPRMIQQFVTGERAIAPLAVFRVLFGFIMFVSIVRFSAYGWIYDQYINPEYFFTYYGFDWVQPLGATGMYIVFGVMTLAALGIMLGWYYRIAASLFFLLFTYVELIDKTNYLNHYYFVSLVSFLLILVPAHRYFSVDVLRKPALRSEVTPAWSINIFKLQLGIVYFFAGVAKLNYDWLFKAMPLKLWLPANAHLPVIGELLQYPETAYLFSWAGAFYDLTVVFFLLHKRTRLPAYIAVIVFHMVTWWFFQIGMFPFIMILSTLIYFSRSFHQNLINTITTTWKKIFGNRGLFDFSANNSGQKSFSESPILSKGIPIFLGAYIIIQLLLPFRYLLYPGNLFWNEEGYRFSWRVMLMEKAGYTTFTVHDKNSDRSWMVANWEYLTPVQEKMMATQPDMILQFAHFLEEEYKKKGLKNMKITASSRVTLNGRLGKSLVDPNIDLTQQERGWSHKDWILPLNESENIAER